MRVLGLDPGSRKTGWGVIDVDARGRVVHVDNGVLFLATAEELPIRLVELCHRLKDVVTGTKPDVACVEDVFVDKGARSALILGQARGAVIATLGLCGVPVSSLSPSAVKLAVTGRGRADKAQVAAMIAAVLGLREEPFEDAADALAVAIAGAAQLGDAALQAFALGAAVPVPKAASRATKGRATLAALARAQGKA